MSDIFSLQKQSSTLSNKSKKAQNHKIRYFGLKVLIFKGFRCRINVKTLPGKPDVVLQ